MVWLVVFLFVVGLIFIPAFRKVAGGVAIIGLILIGIVLLWLKYEDNKRQKEEAIANSLIRLEEVATENMSMYGYDKLTGRIYNKSQQHTINKVVLHVTLRDGSVVVGETDTTVRVEIPPGQAREVSEYLYFSSQVPPKSTWDYYVKSVSADLP